jgi:hypothetical protein
MPYKITFEPLNRISGVKSETVEIETAAEAWKTVDGLQRSDEKVTIRGPSGREIGWQELRDEALKKTD